MGVKESLFPQPVPAHLHDGFMAPNLTLVWENCSHAALGGECVITKLGCECINTILKSPRLKFIQKLFCATLPLSLAPPPSTPQITNPISIVFSCFQQSLLKSWVCVLDKYIPVATCKRDKPQHETAGKYQGSPLFLCK